MDILVVDDSPTILAMVKSVYEKANHTVRTASDGIEALDRIQEKPPDLLLTDLDMPRMDGLTLLKRVRQERPHVEVIVLSGVTKIEAAIEAMRNGALDYLLKPVQEEDLLSRASRVADLLAARREHEEGRAQVQRLTRMAVASTIALGVSRELNDPLCALRGNIEMLEESLSYCNAALEESVSTDLEERTRRIAESGRDLITNMRECISRIAQLATGLNAFCNPKFFEAPSSVDIRACIEDALLLTAGSWRHIAVEKVWDPSLEPLVCSRQGITQALVCILQNAFQAANDSLPRRVRISTAPKGSDSIQIVIEDSGPGIPEAIREKVFEPFFTTRRGTRGGAMGLGLTVADGIIRERHGGSITLGSSPLGGARVVISLPRQKDSPPPVPIEPTSPPPRSQPFPKALDIRG